MFSSRSHLLRLVAAVLLSVGAASCSGDDDASATATGSQGSGTVDVEFFNGEVPESLPGDFPIPAQAVIGSGMINRTSGTTELIVRIPASVPAATAFYEDNFTARSYEIISSEAKVGDGWVIEFGREGLTGTVELSPIGTDLSQAVVRARG